MYFERRKTCFALFYQEFLHIHEMFGHKFQLKESCFGGSAILNQFTSQFECNFVQI